MSDVRLDEFDRTEWWDVVRQFAPQLTWEEFCVDWDEFQAFRAKLIKRRALS